MSAKHQNTNHTNIEMPKDDYIEKLVIGGMLIESSAYFEVADILKPEMFYDSYLGDVYTAIQNLALSSKVDIALVGSELKRMGKNGDLYKLVTITDDIYSAGNIDIHARKVYENYLRRQFILQCHTGLTASKDYTVDVVDLIDSHVYNTERLTDISEIKTTSHIKDVSIKAWRNYEEREKRAREGLSTGIHTGLKQLDKAFNGFQRGGLYILAGRPGMGKTAFALNIARKTAMQGNSVLIFSLEMSDVSLNDRMTIGLSGVDSQNYKSGRLAPEEKVAAFDALEKLMSMPIYINQQAGITVQGMIGEAKKLVRRNECDIVIIDYLQLIKSPSMGNRTRNDEVSAITRDLKLLAMDLNVPVILLSQLNREVERRPDKIPILADLRDSGSIEQDADGVMFIFRPWVYDEERSVNEGMIRVAKNRENRPGDVHFWASDDMTDFKDVDNFSPIQNTQTEEMPF